MDFCVPLLTEGEHFRQFSIGIYFDILTDSQISIHKALPVGAAMKALS